MSTAALIAALALPSDARVNRRVPKRLLLEQGMPTTADNDTRPWRPLALSRALLSEVRIEEAWPVDRITRPGKRARVQSGRTNSVERDERGNVRMPWIL